MITAQRIIKAAIKHVTRGALKLRAMAGAARAHLCPACGARVVGFFRYGAAGAWGCPQCGASPRERLVNYLLHHKHLAVPDGGTVLHIAPNEGSLVRHFRGHAGLYIPADIDPARYEVEGMQYVDLMSFDLTVPLDLFYASHVMEHVPDDAAVLAHIFAALRPGGEAWLIVPLWAHPSEDGAPGMSGRERERRFGQWDHVRQYGPDFAERIAAAGFDVSLLRASDMPAPDRARMALDDIVFRARKPVVAG